MRRITLNQRNSRRKLTYSEELELLGKTYSVARESNPALDDLFERIAGAPALFVASGGALAVARLAADVHEHYTGHVAHAVTPLEFAAIRAHGETGVVMFTASGRHPDALVAIAAAKVALCSVIGIVTLKRERELAPALRGDRVQVVTVGSALQKDGFLATNSVLAMATALVAARSGGKALPSRLPLLNGVSSSTLRERSLVLFPPAHGAVALDLEARLHETGIGSVQTADYRNFAHGRHAGLARRLNETTVVAIISPEHRQIALRTLAQLPKATHIVTLETNLPWPASALDLLTGTMRLIAPTAKLMGISPARPGVAPFGRRLYHLRVKPAALPAPPLPIARKMISIGRPRVEPDAHTMFEQEFRDWQDRLREERFRGIVLDYDGTCCTTEGRFELPEAAIRAEIERILAAGMFLGFASGRGSSLHRDLRKWVSKDYWDRIVLGLYNGSLLVPLAGEVGDQSVCEAPLEEATRRLSSSAFSPLISIESHTHQVEVRLKSSRTWSGDALADAAREVFERAPSLPVKVVGSAHSVDVVSSSTTKRAVLDVISGRCQGSILAIGDQGHVGGNDFELLAAMSSTLSVDRCSADPTRCWNLDDKGHRGPAVLLRYLGALRTRNGVARFRWGGR